MLLSYKREDLFFLLYAKGKSLGKKKREVFSWKYKQRSADLWSAYLAEDPFKFIAHPTKQDLMVKIVSLLEKY